MFAPQTGKWRGLRSTWGAARWCRTRPGDTPNGSRQWTPASCRLSTTLASCAQHWGVALDDYVWHEVIGAMAEGERRMFEAGIRTPLQTIVSSKDWTCVSVSKPGGSAESPQSRSGAEAACLLAQSTRRNAYLFI